MRYALLATLLLVTSMAALRPLDAQQIRSPYRFIDESQAMGLYGGYLRTDPGSVEVGPQDAPVFGVRYNLRFTGPLSGEAALGFAPAERNVMRSDTLAFAPEPAGTTPMNLLLAEAGLRFHLTGARAWNGLAPYAVATAGLAADLSGQGELDEQTREEQRFDFGPAFAVAIGGGTDWFLTDRLSLRIDARNHLLRIQMPAGLREDGRERNEWAGNLGISVGTTLHF